MLISQGVQQLLQKKLKMPLNKCSLQTRISKFYQTFIRFRHGLAVTAVTVDGIFQRKCRRHESGFNSSANVLPADLQEESVRQPAKSTKQLP